MSTAKEMFKEAQGLLINGKIKESVEAFTKAIDAGEKTDIAFLSRGVAHLKNNESDMAIHDFNEVVRRNDNNARAHYYRGIAFLTMEDYKDAITDFDRTVQLEPENGAAFFARGTAYANIGSDEMAAKNIKTAITFSEANIDGFQETIGLWRTQFDKTMAILTGERKPLEMTLNEEEVGKIKKWLDEGYTEDKYH